MSEHNDFLDHLRRLSQRVRQQLDQANALILRVNQQIRTLTELDVALAGLVLTGRVIHRQPYTENPWQLISERVFQATLVTPEGIGLTVWDSEDYITVHNEQEPDLSEYRVRFQPYSRLTPVLRSRLLHEAIPLAEALIDMLGPAPF